MRRYSRTSLLLAASLACLAGFVDAVGFLKLGGFFVSFMSGNSTRLGVGVALGDLRIVATAGGLVGLFVTGVVLGALVGREDWRWRRAAVLALVSGLLAVSALLSGLGYAAASAFAALAMGALNAVFQRGGDIGIGVTYMTGALVRMGQRIAAALRGGPRWDFAPFLMLWVSLTSGAVLGALAHGYVGGAALWLAMGASVLVGAVLMVRDGVGSRNV